MQPQEPAGMPDVASTPAQQSISTSVGLLDLEKELSCSICTDILYQPLTLLDCLHTFCGSCLKEWFNWQRQRADQEYERARHSRPRRRQRPYIYTCPSCRAIVRETRPNATVTTLLDMFLSANPQRQKGDHDKQEIAKVYKPGDAVVIQKPSLQLQGAADNNADGADSAAEEDRRLLEHVQEMSLRDAGIATNSNARERRGRRHHEGTSSNETHVRRGQQRDGDQSRASSRQIQLGHQSSLRSLLNPHDSEEMKEEIMRQIAEEGLLDDIDWDNIRVEQEDEISERIAEAYRRRRRAHSRGRTETSRTRNESHRRDVTSREPPPPASTHLRAGHAPGHARSASASGPQPQASNLPPVSRPHLFGTNSNDTSRHRRSTSQGRLPTARPSSSQGATPPAARSATDLSDRPRSRDPKLERPARVSHEGRRSTDPDGAPASEQWRNGGFMPGAQPRTRLQKRRASQPTSAPPTRTSFEPPAAPKSQPNPAITVSCDRCGKSSIEHNLHYTCTRCGPPGSTYDLCLRCYRLGRGCQHWFGFGQAAWQRWERKAPPGSETPHVLRSQKYLDPQNLPPDLNHDDVAGPLLQLGVFCDVCESNANACYWHCARCNDGEWGYCHRCVNQGRNCTHPLLPVALQSSAPTTTPAAATSGDQSPHSTAVTPQAPLVPLILPTTCNVCQQSIPTTAQRLHCTECADGDYDMCMACYERDAPIPRTSSRKCPQGHRLLLVDFAVANGAKDHAWRRVLEGQTGAWLPEGMVPPSQGKPRPAEAIWPWIPEEGVKDELGFPKGAIVENAVPLNEEFSFGIYCKVGGLFPSAYVRML